MCILQFFFLCFSVTLQHIIYSYSQQSGFTVQEAKTTFLETIATWPTFGCTFFDVKVSQQDRDKTKINS